MPRPGWLEPREVPLRLAVTSCSRHGQSVPQAAGLGDGPVCARASHSSEGSEVLGLAPPAWQPRGLTIALPFALRLLC